MTLKIKTIPVTVHVEEESYRSLRSILIMKDKKFSTWVRIIMKDFLSKEEGKKKNESSNTS